MSKNPDKPLTVRSRIRAPIGTKRLTPAMTAALWEIASELDSLKQIRPDQINSDNAVWIEIPAKRLRGPGARPDNIWLRECLKRLQEQTISGEYRGRQWGAVILAEWRLETGDEIARLLIPPSAVMALQAKETFAKIETLAAHRLSPGSARRLYVDLADKKNMDRTYWEYSLDELRTALGVEGRYPSWKDLNRYVLKPALEAIRKFGTVNVTAEQIRDGRRVVGVRLRWHWKTLDEARVTAEETEDAVPWAETPAVSLAPPLMVGTRADRRANVQKWWSELPEDDQYDRYTVVERAWRKLHGKGNQDRMPVRDAHNAAYV